MSRSATGGHRRLYPITSPTWTRIVGGAWLPARNRATRWLRREDRIAYAMLLGQGLKHDPEKWVPVFRKRSCSNKKIERDDDSKKSHPALAARSAEFASDRVNKTDVIGFPQHAFDLAVTIARCESRGRVAKCIASIRVGSVGKQLFHNIDMTAIRGPHQRRTVDDVPCVAVSVMGKQNFDRCRSVVLRRPHQCGLAVEVPGVDISSVLEKHLHQLDVASFGGKHKCRVSVAVARIHLASPVKLGYRRLDVPLICSRDQIIGPLRIIPAHDNPPYWQTRSFENAAIAE